MMLASQEVRWFFQGAIQQYPTLTTWVEQSKPIAREALPQAPTWKGRLDGKPDLYLLIPNYDDMGMKWREGQLQIKGLQSPLGTQLFAGGRKGRVERWIKWTYEGKPIEQAFGHWFTDTRLESPQVVEVFKTRCLRKVRMNPQSGQLEEVDAGQYVERGGALEVTDLRVGKHLFCSVAFEAFPDDSAMHRDFTRLVNVFLETLQGVDLSEANSMSYPEWLGTVASIAGVLSAPEAA